MDKCCNICDCAKAARPGSSATLLDEAPVRRAYMAEVVLSVAIGPAGQHTLTGSGLAGLSHGCVRSSGTHGQSLGLVDACSWKEGGGALELRLQGLFPLARRCCPRLAKKGDAHEREHEREGEAASPDGPNHIWYLNYQASKSPDCDVGDKRQRYKWLIKHSVISAAPIKRPAETCHVGGQRVLLAMVAVCRPSSSSSGSSISGRGSGETGSCWTHQRGPRGRESRTGGGFVTATEFTSG